MDAAHHKWLIFNRTTLMKMNLDVPADKITTFLIKRTIYHDTHDDCQRIRAEKGRPHQLRALLDSLHFKGAYAIAVFKEALQKLCPGVLSACTDPPDDDLLNSGAVSKVGCSKNGKA